MTKFLANLRLGETRIWIYMESVSMGINLFNIYYTMKFKESDYIILPELLQRLGYGRKNVPCLEVTVVFVEMW